MADGREITIEHVRGLLHVPEARVRHGVTDLKMQDGKTVVRMISYQGWTRFQQFTLSGTEDWPDRLGED